jgi:hypothetical protein
MDEMKNDYAREPASQPSVEELRAAPRFTLLIRSAKLICDSGEYLCVIRDVSATGVRLRIFHPLPPCQRFELELATGERFEIERVWETPDHAGFRFDDSIDVHEFIAEASPYPKRALRLRLDFPAAIATDGGVAGVTVRDLSREGARIETTMPLAIRQRLKLTADGLPPLMASVCWRSKSAYGLVFQQVFTFEELAKLAAKLQPFGAASRGAGNPPAASQRYA